LVSSAFTCQELKDNPVVFHPGIESGAVPAAVSPFKKLSEISATVQETHGKAQKAGQARRTARIIQFFLLSVKKQGMIHSKRIHFLLDRKRIAG
jgi:hypothetical protein